jgi:thiazole synthase
MKMEKDILTAGGLNCESRILIGSGKFSDNALIPEIIKASGAQVITVAVRRFDFDNPKENVLNSIPPNVKIMPNTSGAGNAGEAVKIARIAKAAAQTDLIKIEVIRDNKYLLPDNYETAKACEVLAKEGFKVFPYMNADLYAARDMKNAGAAAVMPLASPIGTNRGLQTAEMIRILIEEAEIPVIVDAGLGKPSDACACMEMGCEAIMVNTAISSSTNPALMAKAFAQAVKSGRNARLAGLGKKSKTAQASSPLTGFLNGDYK